MGGGCVGRDPAVGTQPDPAGVVGVVLGRPDAVAVPGAELPRPAVALPPVDDAGREFVRRPGLRFGWRWSGMASGGTSAPGFNSIPPCSPMTRYLAVQSGQTGPS